MAQCTRLSWELILELQLREGMKASGVYPTTISLLSRLPAIVRRVQSPCDFWSLSLLCHPHLLDLDQFLTMLKTVVARKGCSLLSTKAAQLGPANLRTFPSFQIVSQNQPRRRGYASEASEYDVLFIGGGVAGYVGAIKAGQEGLKVRIGSTLSV